MNERGILIWCCEYIVYIVCRNGIGIITGGRRVAKCANTLATIRYHRNDPMIPIGDELLPRTTEETFNLGRTFFDRANSILGRTNKFRTRCD